METKEKTRLLLNEQIDNKNYGRFKDLYKEIYGHQYVGCQCKAIKLYNAIKEWYIKEKENELQRN